MKEIVGLSCGRKNGFCETLLKEAAMGAEELGVKTKIIRAMSLRVLPCTGCGGCRKSHRCILKDDVEWILQKTVVEDCGLILAVPCYHVRANGYFACINERMNHVFRKNMEVVKKTRIGGIIGVGGSGYDGWTSLNLPMADIFMQHTRVVVDKIQVNFCAIKQWNLWARDDMEPLTHQVRVTDIGYDEMWEMWGPQDDRITFLKKALGRSRELGRNVARAMLRPVEEAEYRGERSAVSCPVCHNNLLVVFEDLPHVACPVCWVRGEVIQEGGKMAIKWNEDDARRPRFSYEAIEHHLEWLGRHYFDNPDYFSAVKEVTKEHKSYGRIISPKG